MDPFIIGQQFNFYFMLKNVFILLCIIFTLNSFAQTNNGIVAYYHFNGNANNASGYGYNGIVKTAFTLFAYLTNKV